MSVKKKNKMSKRKKKVKNTKAFNPNFLYFDRQEFYKSKLEYTSKKKGTNVDFNSFDKYNKISGVWAKWGVDPKTGKSICLDVSQNYDIGKEMLWSYRYLIRGKNNQDTPDEEIRKGGYRGPRQLIKYKKIAYYWPVEYRLVAKDIKTKIEREQIELEYAHKYKALFWYPCQGNQKRKVKEFMIPFIEYQNKYK